MQHVTDEQKVVLRVTLLEADKSEPIVLGVTAPLKLEDFLAINHDHEVSHRDLPFYLPEAQFSQIN